MYSTHNEGKSVVAERFIKTLKNKIYKHMATVVKNVYFNVLDDVVKKYNNTYHSSIIMKPKDATDSVFVEYNEEFNKKDSKLKVGDHVRISKYKNIFAKGYTPNWSEEIFVVKKIKNTVPWTYVISDLNGEKIVGNFYEQELQKTDQKEFRIEKVIKKKGDKLFVKWKNYNNSFNSWIAKKDLVLMNSQYFPPDIVGRSNNVKVVLDLSGYLRKDDKTLLKKEDLDYFGGKNYFDGDDGTQNYLVF